jgi:hypothetical protein
MSGGRRLAPGPSSKSAAWRGGSFMLGLAVLALAVDWIAGSLLDVGFGRMTGLLILGGLTISAPYGLGWLRGEHDVVEPDAPVPLQRLDGTPGATYLVVNPADAPRATGVSKAVKPKELGPGWYAAYTVLWRWPVIAGDAMLSGLWSLAGVAWSPTGGGRSTAIDEIDSPESHPAPDRHTF